jgi:hypothetical protein
VSCLSASEDKVSSENPSLNRRKGAKSPHSRCGDVAQGVSSHKEFLQEDKLAMSLGSRQKGAREMAFTRFSKTSSCQWDFPCDFVFTEMEFVTDQMMDSCCEMADRWMATAWKPHILRPFLILMCIFVTATLLSTLVVNFQWKVFPEHGKRYPQHSVAHAHSFRQSEAPAQMRHTNKGSLHVYIVFLFASIVLNFLFRSP